MNIENNIKTTCQKIMILILYGAMLLPLSRADTDSATRLHDLLPSLSSLAIGSKNYNDEEIPMVFIEPLVVKVNAVDNINLNMKSKNASELVQFEGIAQKLIWRNVEFSLGISRYNSLKIGGDQVTKIKSPTITVLSIKW